jgi:hypothetical protein
MQSHLNVKKFDVNAFSRDISDKYQVFVGPENSSFNNSSINWFDILILKEKIPEILFTYKIYTLTLAAICNAFVRCGAKRCLLRQSFMHLYKTEGNNIDFYNGPKRSTHQH